jgi:hypothetical protein
MVVYDKDLDATHFLNVDLDLYASFSLQSFVTALGKKVGVHHVGRTRRTYHATWTLPGATRTRTPPSEPSAN